MALGMFAANVAWAAGVPGTGCGTNYVVDASDTTLCKAPFNDGSAHQRHWFLGLGWHFDGNERAKLTLGYQDLQMTGRSQIAGARVELRFPLTSATGIGKPEVVTLNGIFGRQPVQGLLGGGYRFGQGMMLTGALQTQHLTGGVEFMPATHTVTPHMGLNTLAKPDDLSGCPAFDGSVYHVFDGVFGGSCVYHDTD